MKVRNLLISLALIAAVGTASIFIFKGNNEDNSKQEESYYSFEPKKGILGAISFYNRLKMDPTTGDIDASAIKQAEKFAQTLPTSKNTNFNWEEMGPSNVGGRIRAFLIDNSDPTVMYAGGVSGGLWKSTTSGQSWTQLDLSENIAVASIAQAPNGDIYVGTGEGLSAPGYTNKNSGAFGGGIYKSTDGQTFNILSNTTSLNAINRLVVDDGGKVWAATNNGLKTTDDGGSSWTNQALGNFADIKITGNGKVIASKLGNNGLSTTYGQILISNSYNNPSFSAVSQFDNMFYRAELAVSESNADYIYIVFVDMSPYGQLHSIYRTTDGGSNWDQIAVGGGSAFNLFGDNNQGWYDVAVMVNKTNPDKVYVGGISLWEGEFVSSGNPFSWTKISSLNDFFQDGTPNPRYVHADVHAIVQHPNIPNQFYLGTDGGLFRTDNSGNSYVALNTNLNITQFYAVETDNFGNAIGGTQDNSTPYIDNTGNNPMEARVLFSGDGGWAAVSSLNVEQIFATSQYAAVGRSQDFGVSWQRTQDFITEEPEFFSQRMLDAGVAGDFVTPLILWETGNYPNSIDSTIFVADTNYSSGDVVMPRSRINAFYPFEYTLNQNLVTEDTITVQDPVQSRFYLGAIAGVWMTKEALYYGGDGTPEWFKILDIPATSVVNTLEVSQDGDVLFVGTYGSGGAYKLYRVSNILASQDFDAIDVTSPNRTVVDTVIQSFGGLISSIAIDPADANNVGVTVAGFTSSYDHVFYSNNALSSNPTFASKEGNLDDNLAVYASIIPVNNPNQMIIGTEFGLMATDDITSPNPTWYNANAGVDDQVPVYMLNQQTDQLPYRVHTVYDDGNPLTTVYPGIYNYGEIYAATHGRGIFKSSVYVGVDDINSQNKEFKSDLKLYPNPVKENLTAEFELNKSVNDATVKVFDINGRLVMSKDVNLLQRGVNKVQLNVNNLKKGVYIMTLTTSKEQKTNKFIVE